MSVQVIDTLKPKNNGTFPVVEAEDVAVSDELRLPEALGQKAEQTDLEELSGDLANKANTSDLATATANLQGQINQIEISATAEAVVAPEVAAARVAEDGTEYTTLKERLDTSDSETAFEISGIKRNLDDIVDTTYTAASLTMTQYRIIEAGTGNIETVENQYSFVSNYVDLTGYSICKITAQAHRGGLVYAFYDSGHAFINGMVSEDVEARTTVTEELINIPTNAKYIVLSQRYSDIPAALDVGEITPKGVEAIENNVEIIDEVVGDISEPAYATKSRASMTKYPTNGYIDTSSGSFVPFDQYEVYYTTIPNSGELYINEQTNFAQVVIYSGAFPDSSIVKYGSTIAGTLPTINNKMTVEAGQTVVISSKNDFELNLPNGYQVKYDPVPIQIMLEKIDSTHLNIYVPSVDGEKNIKYVFERYQKTWDSLSYTDGNGDTQTAENVTSSDYWNNIEVYDAANNEYITQGNSNFITKVVGADAHAGDGHGNEVMLYYAFICDGKVVDIDSMDNYEQIFCSSCRYISNSNVYKVGAGSGNTDTTSYPDLDTNGNPIVNFLHKMEMGFEIGNRITINNKLIIKQDGITFAQCHGAMLECYYGDFYNIICNNTEGTRNIIDSEGAVTVPSDSTVNLRLNTSQLCNYVEMYGNKHYIRQTMKQEDSTKDTKSRVVFEFYSNRVKCYFQPVIATYGKQTGETAEEFNSGDAISVTDYRIIE